MTNLDSVAIIAATLMGPVFAVQAQKYLEHRRDARTRRDRIFRTLMATRAQRLSGAHVEALNLIDLEFYEPRRRFLKQNKSLARVRSAWHAYLEHLGAPNPTDEAQRAVFFSARGELFVDLLYEMANSLGYDEFDKSQLRKLSYSPMMHETIEAQDMIIRAGFANIFAGKASFPMRVTAGTPQESAVPRADTMPQSTQGKGPPAASG